MWWKSHTRAYLDYAGATPVSRVAHAALLEVSHYFANPGAIHRDGVRAKEALESARKDIAAVCGCRAAEVYFTSGATEANNLAIIGLARELEREGRILSETHWVTSAIEHASIQNVYKELERRGARVTYVQPNKKGVIRPERVVEALTPETVMISIGWANSEIGTIQPLHGIIKAVRAACQDRVMPLFHTDAGQAPLYLKSTVHGLGLDMMTLDSGKLYGPRGIGVLYVRREVTVGSIVYGGGQERGLRPGTEPVALAAGMAAGLREAVEIREREIKRLGTLREQLLQAISTACPGVIINGEGDQLPHMLNISLLDVDTEYLALALDHEGVSVSTKSACNEGERVSYVVEALGHSDVRARHTLRISMGRDTTTKDIDLLTKSIKRCIVPSR